MSEHLQQPAITVLMPMYNSERYVGEAVESILAQSFNDFEFLIIDDGSTDESNKIVSEFTDPRIKLVKNEQNLKLIATLNRGIDMAKGKYICRMDADDISEPDRLYLQYQFMEANPDVGVCGSWFRSFSEDGTGRETKYPSEDHDIRFMMLYQCPFCHPTVMIRRKLLIDNGIWYDASYPHAEDYEMWLRLAPLTKFSNIPKSLLQYRRHDSNISVLENETQAERSNVIKHMAFSQIEKKLTDEQLLEFRDLNYFRHDFSLQQLEDYRNLLLYLNSGHKNNNLMSEQTMRQKLKKVWLRTLFNNSHVGGKILPLYRKSVNEGLADFNPFDLMKLAVKSIF